jgi:uncharacterized membrane protein YfcA
MIVRTALLVMLVILAVVFILGWRRAVTSHGVEPTSERKHRPTLLQIAIGFVTDFFDTLGIGSIATTTTAYKMLLLSLIAVSVFGSWLGAGIASRLPRRAIQIGIGTGLLTAAFFMLMSQLGMFPSGGTALTLTPMKLMIALVVNFILGVLLMLGIGTYAPSLILFSLLGMDPRAAFPIMMSSGAMMAMVGGLRFMKAGRFDTRAALGLTLGGIPAVLIAGLLVRSLPLSVLRWMVVFVVVYAATMMLRSALSQRHSGSVDEVAPQPQVKALS